MLHATSLSPWTISIGFVGEFSEDLAKPADGNTIHADDYLYV
jgi:hypothetical protein